jgi:hypothetical protein
MNKKNPSFAPPPTSRATSSGFMNRAALSVLINSAFLATASAAVVDLNESIGSPLDVRVPEGDTARLVGNSWTVHWPGPTRAVDVDLNGFELELNTGGGNPHIYGGAFTGPGSLRMVGFASAGKPWLVDITLEGTAANTPDSVVITQGRVNLNKTPGVDALAGTITSATWGGAQAARIVYHANDQINDNSVVDTSASLGKFIFDLGEHTDTIKELHLKVGHFVSTEESGTLTVGRLSVGGVPMKPGTYTLYDGFVSGGGKVVVTGEVIDISGALPFPLDRVVGGGNTARLVGDTITVWNPHTSYADIDLNGYVLTLDNGGGNDHIYNGQIYGEGVLVLQGQPGLRTDLPVDLTLGGTKSNSPEATTITRGRVNLQKIQGADALSGPITVVVPADQNSKIVWQESHQINDTATIDATETEGNFHLDIGNYTDIIGGLSLKSGQYVDTASSGVLTVLNLTVDGTPISPGTYTSADSFVVGDGSVVVVASLPVADATNSTLDVIVDDVIADNENASLVLVTLLDSNEEPVANKTVTLSTNRGGVDRIDPPTGVTDEYGEVFFAVRSIEAGESELTALVPADSVSVTQTGSVTFLQHDIFDISNELHPFEPSNPGAGVAIDSVIPSGRSGRLVGLTETHWNSEGFSRDIDLNENTLQIYTGNGNPFDITGAISGNGLLKLQGGGPEHLYIGGDTANTYTGTTEILRGPVTLRKTSGNALNGTISINGPLSTTFPATGVLTWGASNQVNDSSNLTLGDGSLQLDGFTDTVGTAALTGDFTIKLGSAATSQLRFADSSGVAWTADKVLTITEWNGNIGIGGGTEGIFFGTTASGLTNDQLAQISFVDPGGLDAGTYGARILATGEVVPDADATTTSYGDWAADNAGDQTAEQDFDGDGVPNGVEYFMGETGSSFTQNPSLDESGTVSWSKSDSFLGTFEVQISYDLETWVAAPEDAVLDFGNAIMLDAAEVTPEDGKLFIRLLVSPSVPE